MTLDSSRAPAGLTVGGYTLLTRLGEGGMGVVHLARRGDGPRVALKVLRPHVVGGDEARSRLAREVSSLRRIDSPWVAAIVDADPWGDIPFVATRFVPGLSLYEHICEHGPIRGPELTMFAAGLAEGLASVHAAGVLHRDVKPANVLLEGRRPILIDFGLARVAEDPRLTHTGWLLGTPGYLAPEILYGEDATTASDVHSWAATVAFAGLGRAPFGKGPSLAIMDRVRRGEHDLGPLPPALRSVLVAALDPDPSRRPTLPDLVTHLRSTPTAATAAPPPAEEDPFTLPLAVAALARTETVIPPPVSTPIHLRSDEANGVPTRERPRHRPYQEPAPIAPAATPAIAPAVATPAVVHPPPQGWQPAPQGWQAAPPVEPWGLRLRRLSLGVAIGAVAAAVIAAFPWIGAFLVMSVTLLLRAGSLAASAANDRRLLRGQRRYDGALMLVASPYHLLQAVPGTAVLGLWALLLASGGALLGWAFSGTRLALAAAAVLAVVGLVSGPGSRRLRSPVRRATTPVAVNPVVWLVTLMLVTALAGVFGTLADQGPDWTPWEPTLSA